MYQNNTDLTLLMCSYNTPYIVETSLKSFVSYNKPIKLLISENSTDDVTENILKENNIKYFRNPGMRHSDGVDFLIQKCETDFALLVDSDVIFTENVKNLFDIIYNSNFTIAGELCGDRGGKKLFPRIQPWFCFMNVKKIKQNNWEFGSDDNPPNSERLYDVGSKLFESVLRSGEKIVNLKDQIYNYHKHYEGMSWRKNVDGYKEWAAIIERKYEIETQKYKNININGFFV